MITIGWNLTSVLATPTSLTLSAVCDNSNTYAVGPDPDGKVPGTATEVVWDVYSYNQMRVFFLVVLCWIELKLTSDAGTPTRHRNRTSDVHTTHVG
jgi:hypothetical protein